MGQSTNSVFNDMFSREAGGAINAFQQSNQDQAAGKGDINLGADFWKKILTGDRSAAMSALSPEIGTISSQYQGARKAAAEFSGRSGGRAADLQTSPTDEAGKIENLMNTIGPEAAQQTTDICKFLASLGIQNENIFAGMQGNALASIQTQKQIADQVKQAQNQQAMSAAGQMLATLMLS